MFAILYETRGGGAVRGVCVLGVCYSPQATA